VTGEAIITVSAAVVALTQLVKWAGLPPQRAPLVVAGLAALGVALWGVSDGFFSRHDLFSYFAGWVAVATSAAGVFGFTRAAASQVTEVGIPPADRTAPR
jgi:O-antigen/teichoic acid export membrane protein